MLNRLDYGNVVTQGFSLFRSRFAALFPFCLVFGGVFAGAQLVLAVVRYQFDNGSFLYGLLSFVISVVLSIALLYVTSLVAGGLVRSLRGESAETALPTRDQVMTPYINVRDTAIRVGGILGVIGGISSLIAPISTALAVIVGLAALVFSVYLGVRWTFSGTISRAEDTDVTTSISRSESIAHDRFWSIFLLAIVIGICAGLPTAIVGIIAAIIVGAIVGIALSSGMAAAIGGAVGAMFIYAVIGFPLAASMMAIAYRQLADGVNANSIESAPSSTTTTPNEQPPHAGPIHPA